MIEVYTALQVTPLILKTQSSNPMCLLNYPLVKLDLTISPPVPGNIQTLIHLERRYCMVRWKSDVFALRPVAL
jgi:hypothetical protein